MPTAYTAPIETGEITTLEAFALRCARAFSACIAMCDEPLDAPIPEQFEPDTKYYDERLAAAKKRLVELCAMTAEQVVAESEAAHKAECERVQARCEEQRLIQARYAHIKRQVQNWDPGSAYFSLQQFMFGQIEECERHLHFPAAPKNPTPPTIWFNDAIEKCRKDIEYYSIKREEEIKRTEDRNAWLAGLRDSLKPPAPESDKNAA